MNDDLGMKLQAYLDGELSAGERAEVESRLKQDPSLRELEAELRMVSHALKEADPVVSVPVSREFYWNQIERRIAVEASTAPASEVAASDWLGWLRRLAIPLSGVAAACLMLMASLKQGGLPVSIHEVTESLLSETSAVTFRSEAEKVTVVWLYDQEQTPKATQTSSDEDDVN